MEIFYVYFTYIEIHFYFCVAVRLTSSSLMEISVRQGIQVGPGIDKLLIIRRNSSGTVNEISSQIL